MGKMNRIEYGVILCIQRFELYSIYDRIGLRKGII